MAMLAGRWAATVKAVGITWKVMVGLARRAVGGDCEGGEWRCSRGRRRVVTTEAACDGSCAHRKGGAWRLHAQR